MKRKKIDIMMKNKIILMATIDSQYNYMKNTNKYILNIEIGF